MKKKNVKVRRVFDNKDDEVIETEAFSEEDIEKQVDKIVEVKTWTRSINED